MYLYPALAASRMRRFPDWDSLGSHLLCQLLCFWYLDNLKLQTKIPYMKYIYRNKRRP